MSRALLVASGVLGASGVGLAAAGAHLGGGGLVSLAADILLMHAAVIPGIIAIEIGSRVGRTWSGAALILGATLFAIDVAFKGFTGRSLVSGMAPTGGLLLIAGWLGIALAAVLNRPGQAPRR